MGAVLSRERLLADLGCAAGLLLVFSSFQMYHRFNADAAAAITAQFQQKVIDDFRRIRPITAGKSVFLPFSGGDAIELVGTVRGAYYYLAGSTLVFNELRERRHRSRVDFFMLSEREPGPALLTPDNRQVFLYDRAGYDRQQADRLIGLAGAPTVSAPFEVYYHGNALVYVKDGCAPGDVEPAFMLHLIPADTSDLPEWTRERGFHNLDFAFDDHRVSGGPGQCFETLWEETFAVAAE